MSNDNSDLSKQPPQVSNEAETAPAQNPSESGVAKTNFNQTLEYTASIPELVAGEEIADMPTSNIEGIREVLTKVTDPKLAEGEQGAKWFSTLNGGAEANVFGDGFSKTLAREDALFEQTVKSEVGDLKAGTPKFNSKQGTKYTGEAALIRIKSSLGLGTAFTVPLWHSGFWVTLKSPSESQLLELYRLISAEKVSLGRSTYGLMFSNSTSYTSKALFDFALDNVYNSSLAVGDNDDIRNYIKVQDLPILIWGIACAVWPKGFQYQRACVSDPDKCRHVITEKIDLRKLQWTDTKSLTERQIIHMSNRTVGSMDAESVKRYVQDFTRGTDKKIDLSETGSVILKSPNAQEHIDAGQKWIGSIEERYARSMLETENDREKYLYNQAKATAMRQYSHFVKSLEVLDESYDDKDIIDSMLDEMSSDDSFRDKFMDKVSEFIDESMISLIAIPTYKCPNCGEEQSPNKKIGMFSSLIAIDVAQTFFTLLVQKLRKIEAR